MNEVIPLFINKLQGQVFKNENLLVSGIKENKIYCTPCMGKYSNYMNISDEESISNSLI